MYTIINPIAPFDSAIGTTINFTWSGNQIFKVRCKVKQNASGETVYDEIVSSMKKSYTIPANSGLVNGEYYVATITVFDSEDNESDEQEIGTPFYCYSTPNFVLSVTDDTVIKASEYEFSLSYSQAENEALNSYEITLCSYQKNVLQTTNVLYDTSSMTAFFTGLENATDYYVRATGTTLHGMELDTGYIHIVVAYKKRHIMSVIEANNLPKVGGVEIRSNIVSIEGWSDKPVDYTNPTGANVYDNRIVFDASFIVEGDFTKILVIKNPLINQSIVKFQDEDGINIANVYYREGSYASSNGKSSYFELQSTYSGFTQVAMSNFVTLPTETQSFVLYIVRVGNYYDLHLALIENKESGGTEE